MGHRLRMGSYRRVTFADLPTDATVIDVRQPSEYDDVTSAGRSISRCTSCSTGSAKSRRPTPRPLCERLPGEHCGIAPRPSRPRRGVGRRRGLYRSGVGAEGDSIRASTSLAVTRRALKKFTQELLARAVGHELKIFRRCVTQKSVRWQRCGVSEVSLQDAYERYADDLVHYATLLVPRSVAADVVADTFADLLRNTDGAWSRARHPKAFLLVRWRTRRGCTTDRTHDAADANNSSP